jgi:hypothetical protein
MWRSKSKKISFEDARRVLVTVLRDVRSDWAEKIASVPVTQFPKLCGGMGSFTDLCICQVNGHEITQNQEPLANELLSCLREICFIASTSRECSLSADAAVSSCGTSDLTLTGWRCLTCGHAQTTPRGIRCLIAAVQVRKTIREGVSHGNPSNTLLTLWQAKEDSRAVQQIIERAQSSGIEYTENEAWMRPCPHCGSDDTCVYRWKEVHKAFAPTEDNLPLRTSGAQ